MPSRHSELRALPDPDESAESPPSLLTSIFELRHTEAGRRRLQAYTTAIEIIAGVAVFAAAAPHFGGDLKVFALLVALNLLAERMPISIYGDSLITIGFVFTLPILGLFGAAGGVIVGPLEAVARRLGKEPVNLKLLRNAFRGAAVYGIAGLTYQVLAPIDPLKLQAAMIPAGLAATAVTFSLSAFLISVSVSLRTGQSFSSVWSNHRWVALHYLAFGVVGLSILASYVGLGYWGLLGYLAPALMLRLSMKQYVDKTAENVEKLKKQNQALETANVEISKISTELTITYGATLEALVNALEAR
ncbi:MAG TPA: hypothetical protein VH951_04570, partial [Dehalococcoidia bacterium]